MAEQLETTPATIEDPQAPGLSPEKHGSLFGGAMTEEVLASSRKVLSRHWGSGAFTGLQQWFTPPRGGQLISSVFGGPDSVLDPTAGAGSLLAPYPEARRFGIEIDGDHAKDAPYNAVHGDAQSVVPMLRAAGVRFAAVAANPPFGLAWRDPIHASKGSPNKEINSTLLTYLWSLDLLSVHGQGALICGTDRLRKEILSRPEGAGVYAIVDIQGEFFDGVSLPVSIAFFVHPKNRAANRPANRPALSAVSGPPSKPSTTTPEVFRASRAELPYEATAVIEARSRLTGRVSPLGMFASSLESAFNTVAREHAERAKDAQRARAKHRHDLTLKGDKVGVGLSAYAQLALAGAGIANDIRQLANQHVAYFGQNKRDWVKVQKAREAGHLKVAPELEQRVEKVLAEAEFLSTPLFKLKPQMPLGWLTDLDRIPCTKSDPGRGYQAGEVYDLFTSSKISTQVERRVVERKNGEPELRKFETERKLLSVKIGPHTLDESNENIQYLTDHFDIPDPGDVGTRFPRIVSDRRELLKHIARKNGFEWKLFQLEHMSRLLVKQRGMLAHEQGLGKTAELMGLTEATIRLGADPQALFVIPQDLTNQWMREGKKFFNRRFEVISNPLEARDVARRAKAGEPGWFLTYFEALSLVGRRREVLPHEPLDHKESLRRRLHDYRRAKAAGALGDPDASREAVEDRRLVQGRILLPGTLPDGGARHKIACRPTNPRPKRLPEPSPLPAAATAVESGPYPAQAADEDDADLVASSRVACPRCGADTFNGWDGQVCKAPKRCVSHVRGECPDDRAGCVMKGCGYTHRNLLVKPAYGHLTRAFKTGVVCVDEVSEIRGDDSLRSKAIRALAAGPYRYGATGTPLSNFIADAFWGLWFSLGNASPLFPYDYHGKAKFESDFCVIEYMNGRADDGEDHLRKRRTILPRITNVSQFWRLAQPGISRCRKEQTGEPIVERTHHPITVPMGAAQKKMHAFWLTKFADYFRWRYPEHPMAVNGLVDKWAAALGQLWHLERAATLPASDAASTEWDEARTTLDEPSNWTPANMKVLELAMKHAASGEKVLIGSDLILTGKWLADRLCEKGIRAVHITEERGSGEDRKIGTKNPRKRAREIDEFVTGDAQVLCAGVAAMKLGHNLDVASTVILTGLPYSFMVADQFIARVHRLTSKHPVSIYTVIPKGSLTERKWTLLKDKGGTSDLAFDGELSVQPEKPVNWNKVLAEMKAAGIRSDGSEVLEADIEAAWRKLAPVVRLRPSRDIRPFRHEQMPLPPDLLAAGDYVQSSLF